MTDPIPKQKAIWCPVANVTDESDAVGPGTRHFSPGTKVYVFPYQWGDGGKQLRVLGKHRGARGLCEMVIASKKLVNWRLKMAYEPFVLKALDGWWDDSEKSKTEAQAMVDVMNRRISEREAAK